MTKLKRLADIYEEVTKIGMLTNHEESVINDAVKLAIKEGYREVSFYESGQGTTDSEISIYRKLESPAVVKYLKSYGYKVKNYDSYAQVVHELSGSGYIDESPAHRDLEW